MSKPTDFYGGICFEVLGFDIMLDTDLKPWLIEINCRPSFQTDTPLDYKIKKNLILETLKLISMPLQIRTNFLIQEEDKNLNRIYNTFKKLTFQ